MIVRSVTRRLLVVTLLLMSACRRSDTPEAPRSVLADAAASDASAPDAAAWLPDAKALDVDAGRAAPSGLSCLADLYGGRVVASPTWALALDRKEDEGAVLLWDDGKAKSPAERIDAPDLEDMFVPRYPTGPIVPITDEAQDPGRARVEAFFRAIYGATPKKVEAALVDVSLGGHKVRFHRRAAPALERVDARLTTLFSSAPKVRRFFRSLGGTYAARTIAGTERTSAHAWGIAIDIDTSESDYWRNERPSAPRWRNRIDPAIVAAFEAEGFVWGGRWFHYDTMHFEYRPELLDPRCVPKVMPGGS